MKRLSLRHPLEGGQWKSEDDVTGALFALMQVNYPVLQHLTVIMYGVSISLDVAF